MPSHRPSRSVSRIGRWTLLSLAWLATRVGALAAQAPEGGRITGRVLDRETGRPLSAVRVSVENQPVVLETDMDGRFRTAPLVAGVYTVRAARIGFGATRVDSVVVRDGQSAVVDIALVPLPLELSAVTVEAAASPKASNDAGLLALQQAASAVTDGTSAQAIARSPDTNAGEAVRRVTGVTLFDGKFLVVRGLGERWSNALLNGAEMPNPVVEKKIEPLDLFPSGLIESVVAVKTATPDKPGDFAGGSVDLTTKDFPENRLLQLNVSQLFNDQVTFQRVSVAPRSGTDFLAIDDGWRQPPPIPYGNLSAAQQKPILQGFRDNVWAPPPRHILPGLRFGATYGDQWGSGTSALGAIASLTYTNNTSYTPERLSNIFSLGQEAKASVDWGGVVNLSYRLGARHRIGWKNLYTRSADETTLSGQGSEGVTLHRFYQVRYIERYLWQTQLTGQHGLFGTTLEWKGTLGRARINDPDNHSADYATPVEPGAGTQVNGKRFVRTLADLTRSVQGDWSIPVSLRRPGDALLKLGGYYRAKHRDYDGRDLLIGRNDQSAPASGLDGVIETLPPEQVFAPENLGTYFSYVSGDNHNDPFFADDHVSAAYGMADIPVLPRVRLVTGVRVERWLLTLQPGGNDPEGNHLKYHGDSDLVKYNLDPLWSANLTIALSDRMNVRFANSRTLARPDSREISPGSYTPIAGLGNCTERGNPKLVRSLIDNGDVRWELYPRPGELVAVSGFYKRFDQPIIELRTTGGFNNPNVECTIGNGQSAEVRGGELEARKLLDFLPGPLGKVGLGLNLTVVSSSIAFPSDAGLLARRFLGQSPVVVNGYLAYEPPGSSVSFSLLYNYFGDRITKYANNQRDNAPPYPNPNWIERGRSTLDAKLRLALSGRLKLACSGKNLLRSAVVIAEDSGDRRLVDHYNPGVSVSTTLTYDF